MNRKDYVIITFFVLIFAIILYQKKFSGKSSGGSGSGGEGLGTSSSSGSESGSKSKSRGSNSGTGSGSVSGSDSDSGSDSQSGSPGSEADQLDKAFADLVDAFAPEAEANPKKGVPPAGLQTTTFYDEKGNFKSYYDGKLPDEFLTKLEYFTDPHKMQDDIYYKKSKMIWHQLAERDEFKKFHDWRGKDKKKYNELLDMHAKARHEADQKNNETWKQLKRDYYQYDSELR